MKSVLKYGIAFILTAIVTFFAFSVMLTGCAAMDPSEDNHYFVDVHKEVGGSICYEIHTHVMYWMAEGSGSFGTLTLLVDADGKPMIWKGEK